MKKIATRLTAAILLATTAFGISACGFGGGNKDDEDTIRYVVYTGGGSLDEAHRIYDKVDSIVYEKLGFHVDFEPYGYTEYANKLSMKIATGETFDMCYSGSLLSGMTYSSAAADGVFADITEALPQYAPDVYNSLDKKVWEAAMVDGKIYGVINEQLFARSTGLAIDKEIAEAMELTQEKIDEMGWTYRDVIRRAMVHIEADTEICKDGKIPSTTLVLGNGWDEFIMQSHGLDALGANSYYPGVIEAVEGKTQVINQYDSKYFKEFADFCREVYEEGWIADDQDTSPVTSNQRVRMTGTYYPYSSEAALYNSIGRDFVQFQFGTPLMSTANVTSSMTAINVRSTKMDKCLKFINLLYTDKDLYNLLTIGEEGLEYQWQKGYDENDQEYQYVSYNKKSQYKPMADWAYGCEFNAYRKRGYSATWVEEVKAINNDAAYSPAYGFAFVADRDLEGAMDSAYIIAQDYIDMFLAGQFSDDKTNDQIIAEMNTALAPYVNKIITAKQNQLDAFLKK
ncbi:MAG: extracellular solute-binding protein [Clostridia bacterium]|nr:extracellular solute-binding protein [Clostridia bacterium]